MDSRNEDAPRRVPRKEKRIIQAATEIMNSAPQGDEIAFLHSTFCQVGLPRSKPKSNTFERRSGNAAIRLESGAIWMGNEFVDQPLPYGTRPRLLLLHLIRTYLRTKERKIDLGTMRDFLVNVMNIDASGGPRGGRTVFRKQMLAFVACKMMIGYNMPSSAARTRPAERLVDEFEAWPEDLRNPRQGTFWRGSITITRDFAASIEKTSVPLDARAIRAIQDSALALDLYAWLAHRLHRVSTPTMLHWASLREQFGTEIRDPKNFKRNFTKAMSQVLTVYPDARVQDVFGGIRLLPSPPPVPKLKVVVGG